MQWSPEAEAAIKKVPFFVRKRVRARVETEARQAGRQSVTLADVKVTQARYLKNMGSEIKGYQVDACFGPNGCPNRALVADGLVEKIEQIFKEADLLAFLRRSVKGDLKFHHEFRVSLADCPNACSQPQIKDIGIIGAAVPLRGQSECSQCEACVTECKEGAIALRDEEPVVDRQRCVNCGRCAVVCPTGTLEIAQKGFRVQLGGKLGRHPRLARELPGIYSESEVLDIIRSCIDFYVTHSRNGMRFANLLDDAAYADLQARFRPR